jgi:hypothetical protein
VHRALLAVERARYEKVRGRIENNSAFLQLVISDPWFDWLRPMAQLVLLIDERASDKGLPLRGAEARSLMERSKTLLQADSEGDAFQRLFYQAVQSSPTSRSWPDRWQPPSSAGNLEGRRHPGRGWRVLRGDALTDPCSSSDVNASSPALPIVTA